MPSTQTAFLSVLFMAISPTIALAFGANGGSGAHVAYHTPGQIGDVILDPYGMAPLTAIIENGGYTLKDVFVRIVPKDGGQEVSYKVGDRQLLTHGGIPIFGLYSDFVNTVEVTYKRLHAGGKVKQISETYRIYTPPVRAKYGYAITKKMKGNPQSQNHGFMGIKVQTVEPEFSDRLYLVNFTGRGSSRTENLIWNNPQGGALEWNNEGNRVAIIDTKGEIRWFLDVPEKMLQFGNPWAIGNMMGFHQNADGALSWAFGQRYVKYDILGREVFDRLLPRNYIDQSHAMDPAPNGHFFIRAAAANYKRADGLNVRSVRDVIVEVDENGYAVDEWKLMEILDPYRDDNLKAMDQGAVCLNVDTSKSGQTVSAEELARMEASEKFGDITGVGPGRNWAHVNSVSYDTQDDSVVLSLRNQSAVVKVGRDKQIKWILSSPVGWKDRFKDKILKPIDAFGKPIKCEGSVCEGGFDWSWTQHSAFKIVEKSDGRYYYMTVFDNGDSRGMEQPPLPNMKYSRAVIYKIDQQNMTVEQIWSYGQDRGNEWYSPITSLCKYEADKNSIMVFSATAGGFSGPHPMSPTLDEFKWGASKPSVEITFSSPIGVGYRVQ
ncbi:aryl-sulfate sulfotransferase [Sutterella wadsworthensis]|uniref:aryl-sulfate sulfotransferase n=1 Tax=Sutterella wadsworthensis TaxID=40545 RepID=UPI003A929E9E